MLGRAKRIFCYLLFFNSSNIDKKTFIIGIKRNNQCAKCIPQFNNNKNIKPIDIIEYKSNNTLKATNIFLFLTNNSNETTIKQILTIKKEYIK
jgi:hypothetical protein